MTGVSLSGPLKVWLLVLSYLVLVLEIGSSAIAQVGPILKSLSLRSRARITGDLL